MTTLQQITDSAVKDFRDKFQNPENTGYRVGQEFLGAVEVFIASSIKKAVEEAYKEIEVEERKSRLLNNLDYDLIEKKKSLFLHECCDGECNHDDCCGKVKANCPLKDEHTDGICQKCRPTTKSGGDNIKEDT